MILFWFLDFIKNIFLVFYFINSWVFNSKRQYYQIKFSSFFVKKYYIKCNKPQKS